MTITVDFGRLHPAAHATWTAIGRLVTSTNTQTWAVVGGQMVTIHATAWGVEVPRATDDGDIVVDVRTFTRNALRDVADALVADDFGFEQSHERDLATLLMCAARDPRADHWAEATTKKDRKRLATAWRAFLDDADPCWSDGADRSDLETVLAILLGQSDRVTWPGRRCLATPMLGSDGRPMALTLFDRRVNGRWRP